MTNTKNNERKTIIKGQLVDIEAMTKNPFEIEVAYVRSDDRAYKAARAALNIDNDNIIIKIDELIQEKAHKTRYNDGKVFERALCIKDATIEDAKNNSIYDDSVHEIVPITYYEYDCAFWAYDKIDDNYISDYVVDNSPLKMTAVNMRQFLTISAHNLCGLEILAIHNAKRTECKRFAIIRKDELENCLAD